MKGRVFFLISILLTVSAFGQGTLEFETVSVDFGKIKEEEGVKSAAFTFKNTGSKSVKIFSVRSSCGCTTSGWPDAMIEPGDTGRVLVNYNPLNRPGRFKKNIMVNSSASNTQVVLTIEGYVEPKPKSLEEALAFKMGNLNVRQKSLNMGKVTTKEAITKEFEVLNSGSMPIIFYESKTVTADFIRLSIDPDTLKPNQLGILTVNFDPIKKGSLGFSSENLRIFTNDPLVPEKEFYVISTVEEYFPPLTAEESARAPRLVFDKSSYDFGLISRNTEVKVPFVMTNEGKTELVIREIRTNCGCTTAVSNKLSIAPGKSQELVVTFTSIGRKGRQIKNVTVFSNDPSAPTQTLTIKSEIY